MPHVTAGTFFMATQTSCTAWGTGLFIFDQIITSQYTGGKFALIIIPQGGK